MTAQQAHEFELAHQERMRLIYKPFFIEYQQVSYPWSGANTGGYLFTDVTGGHWVGKGAHASGKLDLLATVQQLQAKMLDADYTSQYNNVLSTSLTHLSFEELTALLGEQEAAALAAEEEE